MGSRSAGQSVAHPELVMKPVFATDVDGVLFDWDTAFVEWLKQEYNIAPSTSDRSSYYLHNWYKDLSPNDVFRFIETFNQSKHAYKLPIVEGAQAAIKRLSIDFDVIAVTAFAACENGAAWRTQHLMREFVGLKEVVVLPLGSTKRDALARLQPAVFIDDCTRYLLESHELGINTVVMDHPHNQSVELPRIKHWNDIDAVLTNMGIL